jgi:large subunit ribosomal protein L13
VIVIDAERQVLGRMASYAAKKAIMGEQVVVVNCEKAYVSGNPKTIERENLHMITLKNKCNFNKGPYHSRRPDNYVRRAIRGMLPWKTLRGREAYKRVLVYIGVPENELSKRNIPLPKPEERLDMKKLRRKMTVAQICKTIGGKW